MAAAMERTRHPGIYRRGGRYVVVWQHRGRQYKSFHGTIAEALDAQGRRRGPDRTPVTRAGFEDYALEWLETYRGRTSRGLSDRTRASYRQALTARAVPHFRGYRLADVRPPDVRRLIEAMEREGLTPGAIRRVIAPLRAMFATAVEDGALATNPAGAVRVIGRQDEDEERRPKALTREQLATLLAELPEEWRLFFELLAHSGLRVSEAIGLTWADVEFGKRPRLEIRRQFCRGEWRRLKSRYGRRPVPLSARMAQRLWVARGSRGEDELVFSTPTGTPLRAENVATRVLRPAARRAGLEWAGGFHVLRHTCASLLFESGKSVKVVQEWLGHSDSGFTLRTYIHLLDDGLGSADFLDEAVRVGRGADRRATALTEVEAI